MISEATTLIELAAIVSAALEREGMVATLSMMTRLASGEIDEIELAEWIRVNLSPLLD
jgi:hypothetical protein